MAIIQFFINIIRDAIATSISINDSHDITIPGIVIRIIFIVYKEDFIEIVFKFISNIISAIYCPTVVVVFDNVQILPASTPASAPVPAPTVNNGLELT
jgi:hypothetical protein